MAGRFSTGPPDSAREKRSKDSSAVIAILERFSCILAVMRFFFKLLGGAEMQRNAVASLRFLAYWRSQRYKKRPQPRKHRAVAQSRSMFLIRKRPGFSSM